MSLQPRSLIATALVGALLIAGCGSSSSKSTTSPPASSSSSSSSSSSASSSTPSTTSSSTGTGTTTSASTGTTTSASTGTSTSGSTGTVPSSVANSPAVQQAVAACKSSISAAPTLNATDKGKLETLCEQAAHGNTAQLKKTVHEVCIDVIKDSVPAADQATAEASCPAA